MFFYPYTLSYSIARGIFSYMLLVLLIVYVILSKNDSRSNFISESGCKGNQFLYLLPNFSKTFLKFFSRKVFKKVLLIGFLQQTVRWVILAQSFYPVSSFNMSFLTLASLWERVQKYSLYMYPPNLFTSFFIDFIRMLQDCYTSYLYSFI